MQIADSDLIHTCCRGPASEPNGHRLCGVSCASLKMSSQLGLQATNIPSEKEEVDRVSGPRLRSQPAVCNSAVIARDLGFGEGLEDTG